MKLLFVGYLHGFGGAEKMLINLANEMGNRNHQVYMISLSQNNPCYPLSEKIVYSYQEDQSKRRLWNICIRFKALKECIEDVKPDLVIHFNFQSAYFCAFMGGKICHKTIYAERGDPSDNEYSGVMGILRKYTFKKLKGFVFQSAGARDYFDNSIRERSVVIHNPVFINKNDYAIPLKRDKRIVTVGRLHKQKNQRLIIDAFYKVRNSLPEYKLEIYGDGEEYKDLSEYISTLNMSDRITLNGSFKNIYERIFTAALFVLSSDYEGMPNALLEAMALGIPCISTDCKPGGVREIIQNEKNGLIVPCGDSERLANAMMYILENDNIARRFSSAGKQVCDDFSPDKIYSDWERFFECNV